MGLAAETRHVVAHLEGKGAGTICMLRVLGGELLNWVTFDSIMAFLNMVKVNAFYW
jgi:hypothetical protein